MNLKVSTAFAGLIATIALLSGCAGAPTRFYTLDPAAPAQVPAAAYAGPPLRIDAVHVPPALDRPELVDEIAPGRMKLSDNDHWAGPLGELMRRALTQDLEARLPRGAVIFPDAPKPAGAAGVVIDILAISRAGGATIMDVSWTIILASPPPGAPTVPSARQQTARLSTPLSGVGVTGDAAEFSELLGQLADRIAAGLNSGSDPA